MPEFKWVRATGDGGDRSVGWIFGLLNYQQAKLICTCDGELAGWAIWDAKDKRWMAKSRVLGTKIGGAPEVFRSCRRAREWVEETYVGWLAKQAEDRLRAMSRRVA